MHIDGVVTTWKQLNFMMDKFGTSPPSESLTEREYCMHGYEDLEALAVIEYTQL